MGSCELLDGMLITCADTLYTVMFHPMHQRTTLLDSSRKSCWTRTLLFPYLNPCLTFRCLKYHENPAELESDRFHGLLVLALLRDVGVLHGLLVRECGGSVVFL